jgi:hypothetical protein
METSHNQINQKEDCEREISVFKIKSSRLINMGRKMTGFNMYMCLIEEGLPSIASCDEEGRLL